MSKKNVLLWTLVIVLLGCKSKKKYSDQLRIKNVQTANKSTKKDPGRVSAYGENMPEDTGKFIKFRIESIPEYIDAFSEIAQLEMKAYGIPASITLAQGLLESGFGMGELAMKTNNHFGIKCHKGWQGDYDFHDDDAKGECFRKYNHPMFSFRDHSLFLTTRSRYAFLFNYRNTDYKSWAKGLRKAGYATDKKYPQKLIYLIEKHNLHKYDTQVAKSGYGKKRRVATSSDTMHIVEKGDTLYSLSKRYFVSVDELMQLNNLRDTTLSIGQKIRVKSIAVNK